MSLTVVGTAPDQIPTNADLGSLAFQNKESISFSGGTGALSRLDINAITKQLNVTATDVFVYDTSLDSDGGQWRYRCQHTSWYNEELNTSTRGIRKDFPSVAVIVAEADRVTIHDGDDSKLSMWMTFENSSNVVLNWATSGPCTVSSLSAINGIIAIGKTVSGALLFNMVKDDIRLAYFNNSYSLTSGRLIKDRNNPNATGAGWYYPSDGYVICDNRVRDVAMEVLPNAPVDTATGLPIPTIAIATANGVSVIRHNHTVTSYNEPSYGATVNSIVINKYKEHVRFGFGDAFITMPIYVDSANISYLSGVVGYNGNKSTGLYPYFYSGISSTGKLVQIEDKGFAISDLGYYHRYEDNLASPRNALDNIITTKFNTGWMHGDTKGCWLSDTRQEVVISSELVTNGTFATGDFTGWTISGNTTPTISGGGALLTTGIVDGEIFQSISQTQQRHWIISWTVVSNSSGYFGLFLNQSPQTGAPILDLITTSGTYVYYGSLSSISFRHRSSGSGVIDNISILPADADRSSNGKGMKMYGTIMKTPVAAGADLVAYSNFSNVGNYMERPYSSDLDFGTGDFSIMCWIKNTSATTRYGHVVSLISTSGEAQTSANTVAIKSSPNSEIYFLFGGTSSTMSPPAASTSKYIFVTALRRSGNVEVYFDGTLIQTTAFSGNITNKNLRVGYSNYSDTPNEYFEGSIALLRVSSTAPSAAQISKIYNDEKLFFQDNAKATLYGSSDMVTAIAYDPGTKLIHVGTSSGRSVIQGLRRVDNTTIPVGTAISAVNNLVVDE